MQIILLARHENRRLIVLKCVVSRNDASLYCRNLKTTVFPKNVTSNDIMTSACVQSLREISWRRAGFKFFYKIRWENLARSFFSVVFVTFANIALMLPSITLKQSFQPTCFFVEIRKPSSSISNGHGAYRVKFSEKNGENKHETYGM